MLNLFYFSSPDLWQRVALLRHRRWLPSGDAICGRRDLWPLPRDRWLAHPLLSDWRAADCRSLLARLGVWAWLAWFVGVVKVHVTLKGGGFKTCSRGHYLKVKNVNSPSMQIHNEQFFIKWTSLYLNCFWKIIFLILSLFFSFLAIVTQLLTKKQNKSWPLDLPILSFWASLFNNRSLYKITCACGRLSKGKWCESWLGICSF